MDSPKRPMSSYFYYMEKNRAIFQNEYPNKSHKELLTIMSEKWNSLNSEDKDVYIKMAENDKKRYNDQMIASNANGRPALNKNNNNNTNDNINNTVGGTVKPILPIAPIKRLIKMDDEVHNISKNALLSITLSTEQFIYNFAKEIQDISHLNGRKACQLSDIVHVMKHNRRYEFLERDIKKRCVRPVSNDNQCNVTVEAISDENTEVTNSDLLGSNDQGIAVDSNTLSLITTNVDQSSNTITNATPSNNTDSKSNSSVYIEENGNIGIIDHMDDGEDEHELEDMIDSDELNENSDEDSDSEKNTGAITRYDDGNNDLE